LALMARNAGCPQLFYMQIKRLMKKKILIIALCLACTASFAQTTTTKKKVPAKGKSKIVHRPVAKVPAPDTTKKQVAVTPTPVAAPATVTPPVKFDRPLDGYYKKNNIANAKVTPYAAIRESDIVMSRRIWREIDLREKMNQYMASPKARLIDVLMDAIADGELTAYDPTSTKDDPDGDAFSTPLTPEKAKSRMADSSVVNIIDKKTGDKTGSKLVAGEFNPDSIIRFRLKEDWMFDKQRG